jgi:hypothetical protein
LGVINDLYKGVWKLEDLDQRWRSTFPIQEFNKLMAAKIETLKETFDGPRPTGKPKDSQPTT